MVKRGMILRMGKQLPPEQIVPEYFIKATEKNRGKAIIDKNGVAYYEKIGNLWPGGLPFPDPKTGLEVAANVKYGGVWDDLHITPAKMVYVGTNGKAYKEVGQDLRFVNCNTRAKLPPLGAFPGNEDIMWKRVIGMTFPLELKGLGQYSVRYYDDNKTYDTGFAYLPAFKRTIRISATTWQDNVAGSDYTSGDGQGFQEPYSSWSFKMLRKKYILMYEPKSNLSCVDNRGKINKKLQFNAGKKFPMLGWCIWPVWVVEATPKIKHIYSKRFFHVYAWPYWPSGAQFDFEEMYDTQGKLWKTYLGIYGDKQFYEGEHYTSQWGALIYDIQSDHMTQYWYIMNFNKRKWKPEDLTLKTLLRIGR